MQFIWARAKIICIHSIYFARLNSSAKAGFLQTLLFEATTQKPVRSKIFSEDLQRWLRIAYVTRNSYGIDVQNLRNTEKRQSAKFFNVSNKIWFLQVCEHSLTCFCITYSTREITWLSITLQQGLDETFE